MAVKFMLFVPCIVLLFSSVYCDDCTDLTVEADCNANADCEYKSNACILLYPFYCGGSEIILPRSKVCDGTIDCVDSTRYKGDDEAFCVTNIECANYVNSKDGVQITMTLTKQGDSGSEIAIKDIVLYNTDNDMCASLSVDMDTTAEYQFREDKDAFKCFKKSVDAVQKTETYVVYARPAWATHSLISQLDMQQATRVSCIVPGEGYSITLTSSVAVSTGDQETYSKDIFPTSIDVSFVNSENVDITENADSKLILGDPFTVTFAASQDLIDNGFKDIKIEKLEIQKASGSVAFVLVEEDCKSANTLAELVKLTIDASVEGKRTISMEAFTFTSTDYFTLTGTLSIQESLTAPTCTSGKRKKREMSEERTFRFTRSVQIREIPSTETTSDCTKKLNMYMQVVIGLGAVGLVHLTVNVYVSIKMKHLLL